MEDSFRLLYSTVGGIDEARRMGRTLVEERLVACVNLIEPVRSLYVWNGAVQEDTEVILLAKTRASNVDQAVARIKALHSYELPCVIVLPIVGGNPAFLEWIERETASSL